MGKQIINLGKLTLIFITLSMMFIACFEEDEMVAPPEQGDLTTNILTLGEKYTTQFFYDLEIQDVVASNSIFSWDLAFETSDTGWHIALNGAKNMHAGNTNNKDFGSVSSNAGIEMLYDPSHGILDSSAIGLWYYYEENSLKSRNDVYVIDRGQDLNFGSLGMKKISIDIQGGAYFLRYADLDGNNENTISIEKDPEYNFVYFSFDDGVLDVAPKKDAWSLKFTKYATLLFTETGQPYPYTVTGAILNPYKVVSALDTINFDNISLQDTSNYVFSDRADFIGYDWKVYSLDEDKYVMEPERNYIIRDKDGLFYKLRFIDFYDDLGTRGSITMETVRL